MVTSSASDVSLSFYRSAILLDCPFLHAASDLHLQLRQPGDAVDFFPCHGGTRKELGNPLQSIILRVKRLYYYPKSYNLRIVSLKAGTLFRTPQDPLWQSSLYSLSAHISNLLRSQPQSTDTLSCNECAQEAPPFCRHCRWS